MNKTILILLLLLLIPFSVSADENVSLEIFLNSMNEYYVGVDGGSLQPCLTGMCNVTIDRNITTSVNISDDDMREIALQTAIEIRSLTFVTDSLNKSETWDIVNDVVEKRFAAYEQFELTTIIPQTSDFTNLSVKLAVEEGKVATLQANANGYTTQIQAKNTEIELLKREVDEVIFGMCVLLFLLAWFGLPQTQVWSEWKTKLRSK